MIKLLAVSLVLVCAVGFVHYAQPTLFAQALFRTVFAAHRLYFEHVAHAADPCTAALDALFRQQPFAYEPDGFPDNLRAAANGLALMSSVEATTRLTRVEIEGRARSVAASWVDLPPYGAGSKIPADDNYYLMADYTHVLYLHGGAFVVGSADVYAGFVSKLVQRLGKARGLVVDYGRAPESSLPDMVDDCLAAYNYLLMVKQVPAWRIVVVGDSAGGNLVYALRAALDARKLPPPAAAVMLSPWLDLYVDKPQHRANQATDAMLNVAVLDKLADVATRGSDKTRRDFSPALLDAVPRFPPTLVVSSSTELLHVDAVTIADKLAAAGTSVTHIVVPGQPHIFPFFADLLPEANATLNRIVAWIRTVIPY